MSRAGYAAAEGHAAEAFWWIPLTDWNSSVGWRAVSVADLDRPERDNLARGASGWCTTALQTTLNEVGYWIDVDGKFGPATQAQVREHNTKDDGIVGAATRFRLRGAVTNAETVERVEKHDMVYIPDVVCSSPAKWFVPLFLLCEDLVNPDPAY